MKKKILLVDDANMVLKIEQLMLRESGYELLTARNGAEAVETARDARPDLIVLDVVMPEMDGIEACRRIRSMPETARTPIIMVSTRFEKINIEAGLAAGCNEYMTKPFLGPELVEKLKSYLDEE